ncbi:MAG: CHAP domain-containing protein [Ktedonobacterales bacterium]
METVHASAAPVSEQSWLTFSGPWLCRVWTGEANTTIGSDIGPGGSFSTQISPSPVTLAWNGNEPSQLKTNGAAGTEETAVSTATSFGATYGPTTIHCTRNWHVDSAGYIISEAPAWVPDATGAWPATAGMPDWLELHYLPARLKPATAHPKPKSSVPILPKPQPTYQALSYAASSTPTAAAIGGGPYNPWAPVPGHPTYSMGDFSGDPYGSYFGYCTWYAWYRNQSEPLMRLGNAQAWAWNASAYGLHTGSVPEVGATAVFQPGVEGAGAGGHVAHVEVVLGGGWFIVSEMNFSWNGGGWGRVDWRYVYVTSGVTFIY